MGLVNPQYQHRLEDEWVESSSAEIWATVNEKLGTMQQCVLTSHKANCILGSIKSSMVSREEKTLPRCSGEISPEVLGSSLI